MTLGNHEIVRTLIEKFRSGDHDVFEYYDPEIEWDTTHGRGHVSDMVGVYHGYEGVRAYWRAWLSAWQPIDIFEYELRDAGDTVVVLISGQRNRGRHSGIEVDVPPYALLITLQNGKVVRWAFYSDQAEALEAAGARR